jgi:hypothetical protein
MKRKQMLVTVPGIYSARDVDYAAIDAVNQSTLKHLGKSPLHYHHALTHPQKSTVPMRLGSLAHTEVLEPHRTEHEYAVWNPIDEETGEPKPDHYVGKAYTAFALEAARTGRTVVKRRDLEAAQRIAGAVHRHPLARRYLRQILAEPILVWRDEATGIVCKARLDAISLSVPDVMCELKTAVDVSPWAFESAFAKRGYDIQAAFYSDGYKAVTGRELYAKCIAVESGEPHDVIVYDLAEVVDVGREMYRELLDKLAECRRSNLYLGQSPTEERTLRLPKWRDPEDETNVFEELGIEVPSDA